MRSVIHISESIAKPKENNNENYIFFTFTVLCLPVLFFSNDSIAEDSLQWHLPEGAIARLGKGWLFEIQYSLDGTRLAGAGALGVWIHDTATDQ